MKASSSKKTVADPKRSWTQPALDDAIREYKAKRSPRYSELMEAIKNRKPGAKKDARKIFGRNVIVKALGVRSSSMVSKSPAWIAIAEELEIPLRRKKATGTSRTRQTGKIGFDKASEQASLAAADASDPAAPLLAAEREETLCMIRQLPKEQAQPIFEKYEAGEMTDKQARTTVQTLFNTD